MAPDRSAARISAVVIAQDVADTIGRCLDALAFADEIVVMDGGSSDETPEIARAKRARVVESPWPGFAEQRRKGIKAATNEWVLMCDSDEVVTPELASEIRSTIARPAARDGYFIKRKNHYMGRWIRHGPWAGDRQLRLFRKTAGRVTPQSVHEGIEIDGEPGRLESALLHYTHTSLFDSIDRINRYTTLEARDRSGRRRIGALDPLIPPAGVFFNYYIRRRCWRDGMAGFLLSATTAMYKSLLYIKIRSLQKERHVDT